VTSLRYFIGSRVEKVRVNVRYLESLDRSCGCKAGDGVRTSSALRLESSSSCECFESGGAVLHLLRPICRWEGNEEKGAIDRREQNVLK
jgi:hypothetical protein